MRKDIILDVMPTYNHIRAAKAGCEPKDVQITETGAVVKLDSLLEHTAQRLLEATPEVDVLKMDQNLTLISKRAPMGPPDTVNINRSLQVLELPTSACS